MGFGTYHRIGLQHDYGTLKEVCLLSSGAPSTTVEFTDIRAILLGSVLDRGGMASERSEYF